MSCTIVDADTSKHNVCSEQKNKTSSCSSYSMPNDSKLGSNKIQTRHKSPACQLNQLLSPPDMHIICTFTLMITCFALSAFALLLLGQNPVHAVPVTQTIEDKAARWLTIPPSSARFLIEAL